MVNRKIATPLAMLTSSSAYSMAKAIKTEIKQKARIAI